MGNQHSLTVEQINEMKQASECQYDILSIRYQPFISNLNDFLVSVSHTNNQSVHNTIIFKLVAYHDSNDSE